MAGRCLIVANQTLGGKALDRSVLDCISRQITSFYVVVPMTGGEHERTDWSGGFVTGEARSPAAIEENTRRLEEDARRREAELEQARTRAQHRLELMIDKVRSFGGTAEGEVGTNDPLEATREALERRSPFDEIIVSALPAGISRWLKMDLPNRISRTTDVPVTTIEAEASPEAEA